MLPDGTTVELWRSYVAGCILLGIAPCTAMVLMWSYLARGNDGLTLIMVAINSLTMLVLYAPLGGFLLGVNAMPIPWETILLSVTIDVGLPLIAGYFTRKWIIARKGKAWFETRFLHLLTPVSIVALLGTLVLLFTFKGDVIVENPLTILWIAIPLFIQTVLIFTLGYFVLSRRLGLPYRDAAPAGMIGASNHFEVAIAIMKEGDPDACMLTTGIFRRILYLTDFSEEAERCIPFIEWMAGAKPERLVLLHVQDTRRLWTASQEEITAFNRKDEQRLADLKARFTPSVSPRS